MATLKRILIVDDDDTMMSSEAFCRSRPVSYPQSSESARLYETNVYVYITERADGEAIEDLQ